LSGETPQVIEPRPAGGRIFHQRRLPGQAQYQLVVREADGSDRVLVDPASRAPSGRAASLDWWAPSPDGRRLACGISVAGNEAAVGQVVDVDSGRWLDDRLADAPYAAVSWLPDSSGFFYNRFAGRPPGDPAYYSDRSVWLHRPGTPQSADLRVMAAGMDPGVPMSAISSPEIQTGVGASQLALVVRDGYLRNFALHTAEREAVLAVLAERARWTRVCGADEGVADFGLSGNDLFLVATADSPRGRLVLTSAAGGTLDDARSVMSAGETVLDELNPTWQVCS
jgi:prolyl oligopeptidase